MIKSRNRNIMVHSQFNLNGSRGKDAGKFIADYVSRDSATDPSVAYLPPTNRMPLHGDGVAFTMDDIAITRQATLDIADHVQNLHATGTRAIQQMVISFSPEYLHAQRIVPEDVNVLRKNDYQGNYDDVRLRNSVQSGLIGLANHEDYRNPKAIACIQRDTTHLHVHAVMYEDSPEIGRQHGYEERGIIKASSFNQFAHDIDRQLTLTKTNGLVPTRKNLMLDEPFPDQPSIKPNKQPAPVPNNIARFIHLYQLKLQADEEKQQAEQIRLNQDAESLASQVNHSNQASSATSLNLDLPHSSSHPQL